MIARIIDGVRQQVVTEDRDVTIIITGDHTTPVLYGDHTFEPVPFAIARVSQASQCLASSSSASSDSPLIDSVSEFSEISVAQGALGRFAGDQVMELIKTYRAYA